MRVGVADGADRAGLDAQAAAGAVLDVDLQGVARAGQAGGVERGRREAVGRVVERVAGVELRPDHAVRAHEAAGAALDAGVRVPGRDDVGDPALLVGRGAAREGAVDRHGADRAGRRRGRPSSPRSPCARTRVRRRARCRASRAPTCGATGTGTSCSAARVASTAASLRRTTSDPRRLYVLRIASLTRSDRLVGGQHPGDREEAGLQHGVGAPGQAGLAGHGGGVDGEHAQPLVDDLLLHRPGQGVPHLVGGLRGVEQQGARRPRRRRARRPCRAGRGGGSRRSRPGSPGTGRGSGAARSAGATR